ncbi:MAG: redoxin domain-containing protein, partial [Thiotrichales bacterium]|nr:redoxin domain-containing protein [Thiotrichales bacterium]
MSVLVTKAAPDFTAAAVLADGTIVNDFNLKNHIKGKYAIVFFYPLDFTFVCPSEILAFDHRVETFKALNTEVVGISVDSQFTHNAWRNTPIEQGGLGKVKFPLVADLGGSIMEAYGIVHPGNVALRG